MHANFSECHRASPYPYRKLHHSGEKYFLLTSTLLLKGALSQLPLLFFAANIIKKSLFLTLNQAENIALKFRTKISISFCREE